MTVQRLVLLHNMSSSSDAFRSQKFVEERKMKLKQELEKKKHMPPRMIVRPQINKIRDDIDGVDSIDSIDDDDDDDDDDGDDENVIPKPPSSSSQDRRRHRARSLSVTRKQKPVPMRQPIPIRDNNNNNINNHNYADPILSIGSSSSTLDSAVIPAPPTEVPSAQIKKLFQRASTFNAMINNSNNDDEKYASSRGRARVQQAIEEAQAKLYKDDQNENDNKEKKAAVEQDLRSIYQKYLSGEVEKECVVRDGTEWTSRYRSRRLKELKEKQQQRESSKKSDSIAAANANAKSIVSKRYQKRSRIPFRPTMAQLELQQLQQQHQQS